MLVAINANGENEATDANDVNDANDPECVVYDRLAKKNNTLEKNKYTPPKHGAVLCYSSTQVHVVLASRGHRVVAP